MQSVIIPLLPVRYLWQLLFLKICIFKTNIYKFMSPVNVSSPRNISMIWAENLSLMLIEHIFQPYYKFLEKTKFYIKCVCMCGCGCVFQYLPRFMLYGKALIEYLLNVNMKNIWMVDYFCFQTLFLWCPWYHTLTFLFPQRLSESHLLVYLPLKYAVLASQAQRYSCELI